MKKLWVKFLKDYSHEGKEFKKDAVIEVDENVANALVSLKFVELTKAPESDLSKQFDTVVTELTTKLEKGIQEALVKVTANIKAKDFNIIPLGDNMDKMGGFKNSSEFCMAVIKAGMPGGTGVIDERLIKLNKSYFEKAPTGQNTLDDTEGGFLIPQPISAGIWDNIEENDAILQRCDSRQTSGNSLKIKRQPEVSRKEGYRHAGMIAYWTAEAEEYTASKIKWGEMELRLNKITALAYATEEEMADAAFALAPIFDRRASEAIMFKIHESIITGTGAGMPLGILHSKALLTIPLEPNQAANTILHRNINKLYHRMYTPSRRRSVWFVHPNFEEQLPFTYFNDDTTNQRPIYMPPSGLSASPYGTLMGKPVIPLEYCMDFGQKGDVIHADLSQYVTLKKAGGDGGIKSASSIHVRFLFDETAFKFSFRFDGQPLWSAPKEDYRGTTQRGPFVVLANRSGESSSSGL